MNLFELFVKIGVDDQASKKVDDLSNKFKKALTKSVTAATTSIVGLGTAAVKSYAEYEQLTGGVETLFKTSSDKVMNYAENAYKTAGLSANDYMETVTSFAASLLQSLGNDTEAAAEYANTAITDMSDNANKMGTSMEMIQNAYQGFAKQNYTMLDNLKLGYGGTKTEMERLLQDADALSESFNLQVDESGALVYSYADIVDAIHIVQTEMGITGTTAEEAEKTISGSAASMKAAFDNFLVSLVDENADVGESFTELKDSVGTFLDNIIPKIWDFVGSLGPVGPLLAGITAALAAFKATVAISNIVGAAAAAFDAYRKANEGATVAQWLMNAAMNANPIVLIVTLIAGLVAAIIVLWNTNEDFRNALIKAWDAIKDTFEKAWEFIEGIWEQVAPFFSEIWDSIKETFSAVKETLGNFFQSAWEKIKSVWDFVSGYFSAVWGTIKGIFSVVKSVLSGDFSSAWDAIKSIVSGWSGFFSGVWENIKNVFSNAFSSFSSIGSNIVSGIKTGISNAWSNLKSWFSGLFGDLIGIAKRILGIASPSKVFKKIGGFTAEGFGVGFEDEFANVKDDMEDALNFDDASVGINASIRKVGVGAAGGLYGGVSYGDVIININGAKYSDEQSLAEAVAEALQNMTDRRTAVYA